MNFLLSRGFSLYTKQNRNTDLNTDQEKYRKKKQIRKKTAPNQDRFLYILHHGSKNPINVSSEVVRISWINREGKAGEARVKS